MRTRASGLAKLRATLERASGSTRTSGRSSSSRWCSCSARAAGEEGERQQLFAAWRLFFERLSGSSPVVLVFEDLQSADESLLDFVEYLLEWSRNHPVLVVALARPELRERRPTWGAGQRGVHVASTSSL